MIEAGFELLMVLLNTTIFLHKIQVNFITFNRVTLSGHNMCFKVCEYLT
jgi:hypothetical protein